MSSESEQTEERGAAGPSMILEVRVEGLVLIEQIRSGPFAGTQVLLPTHDDHPHHAKITVGSQSVPLGAHSDCYQPGGTPGAMAGLVSLSGALGTHGLAVNRDASGKPAGTKWAASLRLPHPTGAIQGIGPFVSLSFKSDGSARQGPFDVAGAGGFEATFEGTSITIAGQTFQPSGGRLRIDISNMPHHEMPAPDAPYTFPSHHTDVMYSLLVGNHKPPIVTLEARHAQQSAMSASSAPRGVDPAQCTPAVV